MTFNKTQYWKNRSEGKRGQGEYQMPEAEPDEKRRAHGKHMVQVGTSLTFVNRAASRRKVVDHRLTSKSARTKTLDENRAVQERVRRKEAGERQRIQLKREQAAA